MEVQDTPNYAQVARENWLETTKPITRVQHDVLKDQLWNPLEKEDFAHNSLVLLENLQLFERYLWPAFNEDSSHVHVLLIALIISVKRRENLPTWLLFADRPVHFSILFRRMLSLLLDTGLSPQTRPHLLLTIIAAFQSLENGLIRKECAPLVSISIWHNLHNEKAREDILEKNPQFKMAWRTAEKRYDSAKESTKLRLRFDRAWLYTLLLDFLDLLYNPEKHTVNYRVYCERFLEFLSDLQSQFPTRRYVNTLIRDLNLLVAVRQSPLYQDEDNGLIRDLFSLLRHFTSFPIDDHTGRQQSTKEVSATHYAALAELQQIGLKHFKSKLTLLALSNYASLEQRDELKAHLEPLSDEELSELADHLGYRISYPSNVCLVRDRTFTLELIIAGHERRPTFQEVVKDMPLMPTEASLYEPSFLRNESYNGSRPLGIPKLNLQYLTTGDFLWRSFILFRCESFYEIRRDMEETVKRLQPSLDGSTGLIRFGGSSRMALQISKPSIVEVIPPKVGERAPAQVKAEMILNMTRVNDNARQEWQTLRSDDVIYLLEVNPASNARLLTNGHSNSSSTDQPPFQHLRAAEILQVLDDNGRPLRTQVGQNNGYYIRPPRQIRLLVKLDPVAYHEDTARGGLSVYEKLNVVVRRRSRENNFKPILDSIRRLTMSDVPMPSWLQDVFLGLGDPAGATYTHLQNALQSLDFRDTFLDWQHLLESLPEKSVQYAPQAEGPFGPPYVLQTSTSPKEYAQPSSSKRWKADGPESVKLGNEIMRSAAEAGDTSNAQEVSTATRSSKKRRREDVEEESSSEIVNVSTYKQPNAGPYPADAPKPNTVRFTPAQVKAIISGTQPGLTVIVGPPGTGKTDVVTQIINNIYHNFPAERTLLIAHSNQALNQLFQKIVALDIDERHLLRLGHGEDELRIDGDGSYSKHGRVESFLENGARFLSEVNRLAVSIGAPGAHGNSCETASYFNSVYVRPAWAKYWDSVRFPEASVEALVEAFPFHVYFADAPQPLFPPYTSKETLIDIITGCHRHIEKIFSELEDIRPFEVLRSSKEKSNYLLIKEARFIAMTSTHAAMRRQEIANLGFEYDNVVMEEAAQITELETFIPLALQKPKDGALALKRVVLCGDHLQNSPIVQNLAFRQYANLEQSLFLRLIRLGVPSVMLDKQGRARPSLAELYKWRYANLGNLPVVETAPEFQTANAGLRYDYQFINVPDYKGKGEMEPSPHFIQNLGEAEYVVALFMFMRLLGYPASKVSILTTYAGQRALIKDVLGHRCAKNPLFGLPRSVATVDRYQGEQNDYIILSLTRTSRVGYLRDVRRLTVALSRARLGLYIFGRREVFESCFEIKEAFDRLLKRPDKLSLVVGEMFPTARQVNEEVESTEMDGVEHLGQYVFEMTQAKIASVQAEGGALPVIKDIGPVDEDEDEHQAAEAEEIGDLIEFSDDEVEKE